jgi:hypothetical protein
MLTLAATPSSVRLTVFAVPATMVAVILPVDKIAPLALSPEYNVTAKRCDPTVAVTVTVQL